MALQRVNLQASVATDVTTGLGLVVGSGYELQAQGGVVRLTEQADMPDPTEDAHVILGVHQFFPFQQGAEALYAWGNADLVVIDAV